MPVLTGSVEPYGPLIPVKIMQSHPYAAALKARGGPPKPPTTIMAMIDTGAACTAVDHAVILSLDLMYHGVQHIHTPSTGARAEPRNAYDASLVIGWDTAQPLDVTIPVIDCDLAHGRVYQALIGRDVLKRCRFDYDGRFGVFALRFGPDLDTQA